ncbi:MAG: PEP-CTERM sorting domain-containing protein, partial [Tepidisphaeraceae bacterium]
TFQEMMMHRIAISTAVLSVAVFAAQGLAATVTYLPSNAPYDHTEAAPVGVANDAPTGYESGSFAAPGSGGKTEIYLTAASVFGSTPVTIPQIQSISFFTKNSTGQTGSNVDWYITAYTNPQAYGNDSTFYHHALTFEDTYARNVNAPANTWNQFSTSAGANQLTVSDHNRGASGPVYGTATDPTLADLQSGPVNWNSFNSAYSSTPVDYSTDTIAVLDVSTASSWANGFTGQIDGVSVSWLDSSNQLQTSSVNFEAVPEPTTLAMLGLGGIGLLMRRRRGA